MISNYQIFDSSKFSWTKFFNQNLDGRLKIEIEYARNHNRKIKIEYARNHNIKAEIEYARNHNIKVVDFKEKL